jgi:hypothetical protein
MAKKKISKIEARQREDLKAAKKKGLIDFDLRKALTRTARSFANKIKGMAQGLIAAVKVDKSAKEKYIKQGALVKGDKVLVKKNVKEQNVRFVKSTGEIKVTAKGHKGDTFQVPTEVVQTGKQRRLLPGEKYRVTFRNRHGSTHRDFSSNASMQRFLLPYSEEGISEYYSYEIEIV